MQRKAKAPTNVRQRRPRADIREELLQSALIEFGAKGFDGASTRAIAARIEPFSAAKSGRVRRWTTYSV
jgi:AcrR family transcriptional regulator